MANYKTASSNIILSDYPDLDVIRVGETYYMVSTTMHYMPGCVILRSYNLIDWEFCSYVYDELEATEGQTLKNNKGIYGKGMWAACLRYHNGIFYVSFVANDTHKTYLYTSTSITGPWKKSVIPGFFHDMSVLFDDDGKVYVVSGNMDIRLTEMEPDLSAPKKGGIDKIIIQDDKENVVLGYEGSHFYKINGKYYIFFIHMPKGKMRTEACFVSDNIAGPYTGCDVLCSDSGGWNSGVAQGGIVQSNDGKWFGILFQDHGALGRIPVLVPVNFENDFPVFGINGIAPEKVTVLDNNPDYKYAPLYSSQFTDENNKLNPCWQWNHIHDSELAYVNNNVFTVKTDKIVKNVVQAANTLTQRTFGEECSASVTLNFDQLKEGDFAGFCALEGEYGFIGITKKDGKIKLVTAEHKIPYSPWSMGVFDDESPVIIENKAFCGNQIKLKMDFSLHYQNEQVVFSFYDDKENKFVQLGREVRLRYTLDQFVGVRIAMFLYSTLQSGAQVQFSDFNFMTK